MSKKDKYIPWIAVGIVALALGAAGREIALRNAVSAGTANIISIAILAGVVLLYLLYMEIAEPLATAVIKWRRRQIDAKKTSLNQNTGEIAETPPEKEEVPATSGAESPAEPKIISNRVAARQLQVESFVHYSERTLADYISEKDFDLLKTYISVYAHCKSDPIEKKIDTTGLSTFDLYHYGWNMWNHFKATTQPEVAEWLRTVFSALKDVEISTIEHNLKHKANQGLILIQEEIE